METEIQKLLDAFSDLRKKATANAVFGKPVASEGRIVIPVAEVTYDFEMGIEQEAVEDTAESGGGGSGGVSVRPLAVVDVTPENTAVRPVIDEQQLALAGSLLIGWAIFWVAWALGKIFGPRE